MLLSPVGRKPDILPCGETRLELRLERLSMFVRHLLWARAQRRATIPAFLRLPGGAPMRHQPEPTVVGFRRSR